MAGEVSEVELSPVSALEEAAPELNGRDETRRGSVALPSEVVVASQGC
jgi:hypothetical protein